MDSAAATAAFVLDKPALGPGAPAPPPPPPAPALGQGDCAQARKNFTVSHLLDLEEVAAAGRLAARPAARAGAPEGAAREPSGASSGSEAAPQDGECAGRCGARGAWECRRRAPRGIRAAGRMEAAGVHRVQGPLVACPACRGRGAEAAQPRGRWHCGRGDCLAPQPNARMGWTAVL